MNGRLTQNMWEFECYDWTHFQAYRDPGRVPHFLNVLLQSEDRDEWSRALDYLESCGSDLGVPCSMTPALVSCLVSIASRVGGAKRSEIVSLLEELTRGPGSEKYSEPNRVWLHETVNELLLAFKLWVELMECSSAEDAEECIYLLASCAKHDPTVSNRVLKYFEMCEAKYPQLGHNIRAACDFGGILERHFGQGRDEARRVVLLRQLAIRFGTPPDSVVARVNAATTGELDRWSEAIITARTLEEALCVASPRT